ncbi:155_t:CDS:2 [Diversispora eburnea]|uniref:155_t:CDS:1 n=1 Tax=Diversispora eburnea TaxID=1213867 RepID=A0A9N9C4P9_9GLOM|nr:155_t:CDS:2 [Diversispora eburnea]
MTREFSEYRCEAIYDLLELTQTYHAFDFAFKSFNGDTLITIFSIDSTQPKGTIGSRGKKLEGLTLRGGSICRQKLINDSIQYLGWGLKSEEKNARIYVYDSSSMNNPCLKAYYVTHGKVITPLDGCKATKGWWSTLLYSKKKKKSVTTVGFVGRNKTSGKLPGIPYVAGKLKNISIKADFLLVAYEEKKVDKSKNGIKYLLTEGGEEYLKRKKTCVIS